MTFSGKLAHTGNSDTNLIADEKFTFVNFVCHGKEVNRGILPAVEEHEVAVAGCFTIERSHKSDRTGQVAPSVGSCISSLCCLGSLA